MPETNPREECAAAIRQADLAARKGDLARAERWSKTAERLAAAADRLAHLPPSPDDIEAEDELRAELRRRVAQFVDAAQVMEQWENESAAHAFATAEAERLGCEPPPPLRSAPFDPEILERIGKGEA